MGAIGTAHNWRLNVTNCEMPERFCVTFYAGTRYTLQDATPTQALGICWRFGGVQRHGLQRGRDSRQSRRPDQLRW
jgi:hypothetical protein